MNPWPRSSSSSPGRTAIKAACGRLQIPLDALSQFLAPILVASGRARETATTVDIVSPQPRWERQSGGRRNIRIASRITMHLIPANTTTHHRRRLAR